MKKLKYLFTLIAILLLIPSNLFVNAGTRKVNQALRQIVQYGAVVTSKGEPAAMTFNNCDYWQWGGFWSGPEYYYPKEIKFDLRSSTTYDSTYNMSIEFIGFSTVADRSVETYLSNDNSNWRQVANFKDVYGSNANVKTVKTSITGSTMGTFRYIKSKMSYWSSSENIRTSTLNLMDYIITQTDNTPPYGNAPTISASDNDNFTAQVTGVGDSISGISKVTFKVWTSNGGQDDVKTYNGTNNGNGTWSCQVNRSNHNNELGEYIIQVTAYDGTWAGNNKYLGQTSHSFVDSVAPSVSHTVSTSSWTKGNVTINITATDNYSGMDRIVKPDGTTVSGSGTSLSTSYLVSQNGTYTFSAYDKFNNVNNYKVSISNIDTIAPTATITTSNITDNKTIKINLSNIVEAHSGLKEIQMTEDKNFATGITTTAISGNSNKSVNFTLKGHSTMSTNFTVRTVYIRLLDNVGNYTSYTVKTKLIPNNTDKPMITTPKNNQLLVGKEDTAIKWEYSATDSDVGELPQLKAEIILKHLQSNTTKVIEINGNNKSHVLTELEPGDYEAQVKVYNFLDPEVSSISDKVVFRYNSFKENGNVLTKIISVSSPIKHVAVLTDSAIPDGASIECKLYYSVSDSGVIDKSKYKTVSISSLTSEAGIITLPYSVNKIAIEYFLKGNKSNLLLSPILDNLRVLAR